ncbi:MAG: colicin import membrane protein [Halioglobus sp.]|jgi:colicin import membrane protein
MSDSVYARPVTPTIVGWPLLATVALHGAILYILTANWLSDSADTIVATKVIPKVINARLVDAADLRPKKVNKPKPRPKVQAKPKPRPKPKPTPQVKPTPKPVEKTLPKPALKLTPAELAALARQELAEAMVDEEREQAAQTADEMAASYAAHIQQTVVNYWSRPPSARNGMEVLLAIQLIPTGEVVSVTVLDSSGSAAFDRSAVNAVEKAGEFPLLQNLPPREFEKTFRRFRLLFRPEDLRY